MSLSFFILLRFSATARKRKMQIKFNAILERIKVVDYRNYIVGIKKEERHLVAVKRPVVIFQTSSIFYK